VWQCQAVILAMQEVDVEGSQSKAQPM
jgi:hypothetical protein